MGGQAECGQHPRGLESGWIKRYGEGRTAAEACLLLVYCDVWLIQAQSTLTMDQMPADK